jgi:Cdc6-like AAA superfamily ATPase
MLHITAVILLTEFILTLKNKDYSKYGLMGNPFPFSGVPDENPNVYIGQEEVLTKINGVLSSTVLSAQSNHIILTGSYGNGKSHTLKFIKSHIREQFSEKSDTPMSRNPGRCSSTSIQNSCMISGTRLSNISRRIMSDS